MVNNRGKCLICETRPQKRGAYCGACAAKIAAETEASRDRKVEARYFLTYQCIVVGLYANGDETYRARLERVDAETLPKGRTLNVNTYLDGYTREQVKKFKRA